MKNKLIKIAILLVITINLNAQTSKVWKGDLHTKDFDTFLQGKYTQIDGDLNVFKSDLENLVQLKFLKTVNGSVSISQNPMLSSLEGLNNLSGNIPLGLQVYKNKRLQDISQLSRITSVGNHLSISSNLSLQNLEGLHNIKTVKNGYLSVRSNTYLKNLKGLRKIKNVGKEVQITTNPLIEDLKGLEQLTTIGAFLFIKENEKLQNLKGLKSLKSIGEDFEIEKNSELTNLNGVEKLITVKGDLIISKNPLLYDVNGVNNIKDSIKSIYIFENIALKQITGLNKITAIKKSIVLSRNHLNEVTGFNSIVNISESLSLSCNHLTTMNGFKNLISINKFGIGSEIKSIDFSNSFKKLTDVKGFFLFTNETLESFKGPNSIIKLDKILIQKNEKLVSFSGFDKLKTIDDINFNDNPQLKSINGFNSLESVGNFNIKHNSELQSIKGFNSLRYIKDLDVDENSMLSNLNGFKTLESVDEIYLRKNDSLSDLTGFENLQKVNKALDIHNNSSLKSLNGLENLIFIGKGIDITGNKKLINYNALQNVLIESKSNKELYLDDNGYNPNKNMLLIHIKLDTKLIPETYLKPMSKWKLALLRNEIFARKGFAFGNGALEDYFTDQGWYQPNNNVEIVLNKIEEENVKLIKKYEKMHIDFAEKAVLALKKQYEYDLNFSSDYKNYYASLKRFIKDININTLKKSNKLNFSKNYDFDKNVFGIERENDDELDKIFIDFDNSNNTFNIIINDNYLEENEYEHWMSNKVIYFEFMIKNNSNIEFVKAYNDYN
ncbi:YARHG domain-containing protein [Aureibaculum sp. A20]|uniref:YARHG domain-containing protein n=1 Tax=Aureibaculum flavum TaxID=2795986 RepID=A0ABS0WV78_9FLAO|nr:YARHG domain-containing protein [Aureibaculum flavum]MBJ2175853.1 YARHG domain-containing protein [Aureibaculum flavum]